MALQEAYKLTHSPSETKIERRKESMSQAEPQKDEVAKLKEELELMKAKTAEFEKKERKRLEDDYKDACLDKNVKELNVTKFTNEQIETLIDQLDLIEADVDEEEAEPEPEAEAEEPEEEKPKVEVEDEEEEDADEDVDEKGYQIVKGAGTLRGGSFTIVRNKYK
jgi:hypothetical protein